MEECDNTYGVPSQYCFCNIEETKQHTEMQHLDPQLNESNANLMTSLYDDDTMCARPHNDNNNNNNSCHIVQCVPTPLPACLGGHGVHLLLLLWKMLYVCMCMYVVRVHMLYVGGTPTRHLGANKEYASKNNYFTSKNHILLNKTKCPTWTLKWREKTWSKQTSNRSEVQ